MPKEHFLPKECPSTKRVSTDLFPFGAPAMGTQNYQYPTIMKQIMHELTLIVRSWEKRPSAVQFNKVHFLSLLED